MCFFFVKITFSAIQKIFGNFFTLNFIHCLQSQLETERFERGYLEMQLNQCEKKLTKLDDDYKIAMTENNLLKKQIQMLDENDQLTQNAEIDSTVKQLRREINQKEDELFKLTSKVNAANDDIELLQEKLQYAETQVKSLNVKLLDSFNEAETFKSQLDDREKMINYLNTSNKELSDMLKELQSNSKKLDFDSSSSYDLLNSTANDLNTSSESILNIHVNAKPVFTYNEFLLSNQVSVCPKKIWPVLLLMFD